MQDAQARTFTGNSGKAKGREFANAETGEWHYNNHSPYFSVHYYPQLTPEQVWYKTWDDEYLLSGRDLLAVYEDLKANAPEVIRTSRGPQENGKPYIEKIEYRRTL